MKSRKSYCTTPSIGIGVGVGIGISVGGGVGASKMLKFLHLSFLCDGQGTVRRAILSLLMKLTLLHSGRPKLYTVLAFLSAVGLIKK